MPTGYIVAAVIIRDGKLFVLWHGYGTYKELKVRISYR